MGFCNRLKKSWLFSMVFMSALMLIINGMWAGSAKASTQDEIAALKAQVKALMQRIDQLEQQQTKAPSGKAYWKNGFRIEYKNPKNGNEYKFRFRTGIQLRYTYAIPDDDVQGYALTSVGTRPTQTENYSSFNMRRLRFFVDGTAPNKDWKYFVHLQLEPQGAVNTHDAFVIWKKYKFARVQFGRMKIPSFGMEYWQSGFKQNGTDRTIFTGDSEFDKDLFGNRVYDFPGSNARLRVGGHRLANGFPTGGMLLYRSQGVNINGYVDMFGLKQFIAYWVGVYNGRDTRAFNNTDDQMLYCFRLGINFLPGSDPTGPMGPKSFNNYFAQGDLAYNTKPLASFIISGFTDHDKTKTYYTSTDDPTVGYMSKSSSWHDIENYGFSGTFLFRYMGFSADAEIAWEEFRQDPGNDIGQEQTWDRWGTRVNFGYFVVPKKWEVVAKYAYMERVEDNDLENSIESGLGLVLLDDGFAVEDNLQQFVVGVNYYFHGFNQYITTDLCWYHRNYEKVSSSEAAALGLTNLNFSSSPDDTDEFRFRVMYQFWF